MVGDDLRGHILGRAAEGPALLVGADQLLGEAKVGELDIAGGVQQQILWLEVPVEDALVMQVLQRLDNAGRVEASLGVVEACPIAEDGPELATQAGLHEHVEVPVVPVGAVQLDDEGAVAAGHDELLAEDVLLLLVVTDLHTGDDQ